MFLGFAGTFFKVERVINIESGAQQKIGEYNLKFIGLEEYKVGNATHRAAIVEIFDNEGNLIEVLKIGIKLTNQ